LDVKPIFPGSHTGYGFAASRFASMRKILIVRACGVGDFVVNLPALIALQKIDPDVRFTLVGNPSTLELAREFVGLDAVHSLESQPWARLFYEALPNLEFDMAIVWMKDPVVADNLRASGIPDVIRTNPFPAFGHASDHLLRTLNLPRPALPDLWSPASGEVVIHAGSGSPRKNWPYFEELMGRLKRFTLLPQNRSLLELSRYLCTCRLFIGNDSGITHLAAYLGCPTVALFGPTDPRIWGPLGLRSRIIWKTKLEEISVDEVLVACASEIGTGRERRQ
jgi:ADP-heptose:LPS heptosyltransferase